MRIHDAVKAVFVSLSILASSTALTAEGAAMPEFEGVEFDSAGPQPSMAKLKGKAVLILFFQSWCGICNRWAPDALGQFQKTHGNNRGLVTIAIKTDGGGVSGAKSHLKASGGDLSLWTVGSDEGAKFYKRVTGDDQLWGYVLVGPDGSIVTKAQFGSFYKGENAKRYVVGGERLLKECGTPAPFLPADKQYDLSVISLVRMAEMGEAERALSLCQAAMNQPKTRPAAAALKADLEPLIEKRLAERAAVLSDASAASPVRYEAFCQLCQMLKELKAFPAAAKLNPLLLKVRQEPAIQAELRVETAYRAVMARFQKASPRDKPRILKELETLSLKSPETTYGRLAAASAKQLSETLLAGAK